jgi:patatin-like phospholipase
MANGPDHNSVEFAEIAVISVADGDQVYSFVSSARRQKRAGHIIDDHLFGGLSTTPILQRPQEFSMNIKKFHEIFEQEVEAISRRRKEHGRPAIALEEEDKKRDGTPIMRPTPASNVVGLALSGGGIRSAAFSLGAMQALDALGLIKKIDYLSTVSGGGYIGTSMTAAMSTLPPEKFPFASELREGEVPGIQHIRDHSNYLFPQGALNVFGNVVVYLRGILANVLLLLPWLLLAAALTILLKPNVNTLIGSSVAGYPLPLPVSVGHFGVALTALLLFVILLAAWALWRSTPWGRNFSDVGPGARAFGVASVVILIIAFLELQPLLLSWIISHSKEEGGVSAAVSGGLKAAAAFFAAASATVGFLGRFLADILKRTTEKSGFWAFATGIAIKLAMYVAGAAVPLALWAAYLYLTVWGTCSTLGSTCASLAPEWLTKLAGRLPFGDGSIFWLYVVTGVPLLVLSFMLNPNANSLHQLYRDRLSKAFLFDPHRRQTEPALPWLRGKPGAEADPKFRNADLIRLDNLLISELRSDLAPYHLINAALNIEASKHANRRGRNADFFIFSPLFTGSESTGYVETTAMENQATGLTVGTAMAVSGAAASSNMGSATIKPLTPTLAILNVRLGFWLLNPIKVAGALKRAWLWKFVDKLYFTKEMLGLLTEKSSIIYLTDGGHIENLGIYELLRRRCKLIIAVDGEADPDMAFGSLVKLERYARIDFGQSVDVPWATLRDAAREASAEVLKSGGLPPISAPHGPHCALGKIYYPQKDGDKEDDNIGVLLYIKSSLTGDENDYIVDYKRRNPSFPHETTIDQLFTEEQFEAYRALGFHAVNSAFECADKVSMNPDTVVWQGPGSKIQLENQLREILA